MSYEEEDTCHMRRRIHTFKLRQVLQQHRQLVHEHHQCEGRENAFQEEEEEEEEEEERRRRWWWW